MIAICDLGFFFILPWTIMRDKLEWPTTKCRTHRNAAVPFSTISAVVEESVKQHLSLTRTTTIGRLFRQRNTHFVGADGSSPQLFTKRWLDSNENRRSVKDPHTHTTHHRCPLRLEHDATKRRKDRQSCCHQGTISVSV